MNKKMIDFLFFGFVFSFFLVGAFFQSIGCTSPSNHHLPSQRPSDLKISYSYSTGGMAPNPSQLDIFLSEKESYSQTTEKGKSKKVDFVTTPAEMDTLYKMILENRFDKITRHHREIYDSGGGTILIQWGNTNIHQGDDGVGFIDDKWRPAYQKMEQALINFSKLKLDNKK